MWGAMSAHCFPVVFHLQTGWASKRLLAEVASVLHFLYDGFGSEFPGCSDPIGISVLETHGGTSCDGHRPHQTHFNKVMSFDLKPAEELYVL